MSQIVDNPPGLLAALDRGESLPAHWYTDPSITEQEIDARLPKILELHRAA